MIQKRREVIHNCILVAELDVEPCHLMTVDQQIVALHVTGSSLPATTAPPLPVARFIRLSTAQ